jgi:transcriptional regulator with XRE-family HTH domain
MKKGNPQIDRYLVKHLRSRAGMTQAEFGRAAGVDQRDVSVYELGHRAPPEESLRRMAAVAGLPWPVIASLRRLFAATQSAVVRVKSIPRLESTAAIEEAILDAVLLAVTPYLVEEMTAEPDLPSPEEERREADEIWAALENFPPERRRRLIELSPRPAGNAALARRICAASAQAAAHSAEEAADLADLALFTARRAPGGEARCTEWLAEWRLPDLEATLRRERRERSAAGPRPGGIPTPQK